MEFSVRTKLTTRLDAQSAAELNRLLAGDTGFGDGVALAPNHPVDAAIGGAKGIVNGGIALADMMARGEALRAAGDADQAAAIHSLFGNDKTATQMEQGANNLRQTAQQPIIPQIPYANLAQSGGGDIGTVVDVALAGKGLVSGGAKLLAREGAEAVAERGAVWKLGPGPRGEAIEQAFGHNLPSNFPVIDRFNNGVATSIKSMDLGGASYLTGNTLRNTLTRYVVKVAGFDGANWAKVRIQPNQITGRSFWK